MQVLRKDCLSLPEAGKDKDGAIKVIIGMKRSGKSALMSQFIEKPGSEAKSDVQVKSKVDVKQYTEGESNDQTSVIHLLLNNSLNPVPSTSPLMLCCNTG